LALGLEQMESSQQPYLDRYNRGEIDFEQLAEATAHARGPCGKTPIVAIATIPNAMNLLPRAVICLLPIKSD
jgi:hypothetical protein